MRFWDFVKNRVLTYLGHLLCMFFLALYLLAIGNGWDEILLILAVWAVLVAAAEGVRFWREKTCFDRIFGTLAELDKPYLVGEVEKPLPNLEGRLYWKILRRSNKSVIETVHQTEDEWRDYREYIESWVHEVKLPITALELMAQNEEKSRRDSILEEVERIDAYVEQVLFYARSERVYQDFLLKDTELSEILCQVIAKNKRLLIRSRMAVEVETGEARALCDGKWMAFVFQQVIGNAVKYLDPEKDTHTIRIYIKKKSGGRPIDTDASKVLELAIEDNGVGIAPEELGRIFDKGFTGKNGRSADRSRRAAATGMGLYLCRRLCEKMDVGVRAESREGAYTRIIFSFSRGSYLTKL